MSSGVVLSIHGVHARNIYSGVKRYEYRTRKPIKDVEYVAFYETGSTRAITGIAKIAGILENTPSMVWDLTKSFAGISHKYFRSYFAGKKKAVAYCMSEVMPFENPVVLSEVGIDRAPQSFQYLDEMEVKKLLRIAADNKRPLQPRFFVGGIHGAGKSTFAKSIAAEMGLSCYSASRVISDAAAFNKNKQITAGEVSSNQASLVTGLKEAGWFVDGGFLDGHFVLRAECAAPLPVAADVFAQLELDAMLVLTARPSTIVKRLKDRDGVCWDQSVVDEMQQNELLHAKTVSEQLGIPLSVIRGEAQIGR